MERWLGWITWAAVVGPIAAVAGSAAALEDPDQFQQGVVAAAVPVFFSAGVARLGVHAWIHP
ncbi:MAG: hypothetical protein ACRC0L_08505, partial [Angustibacter sp.]